MRTDRRITVDARGAVLRSFPPVARRDARVLVLGSMPGAASLAAGQYYAHPRNAFWPIMEGLTGCPPQAPYAQRLAALRRRRIALWDVLARCERPGSLDADIVGTSMEPQDFAGFFARHPRIHAVFFNGAAAQTAFLRHALPQLDAALRARLQLTRLPSTSPAHAGLPLAGKRARWQAIAAALEA